MTDSLLTSTPSSERPPTGGEHISGTNLDRDADQRAVLGPRAVVVLHVLLVEDLVQHEPGVRAALTDAAVGDRVLGLVETCVAVELGELVVRLEGAVVVRGLAPGDVQRRRDVAAALRLLLRQVGRGE